MRPRPNNPAPKVTLTHMAVFAFKEFLKYKGLETRRHDRGIFATDTQVRYDGHWMAIMYNRADKCYTVDRRMKPLVDEFQRKDWKK